MILEKIVSGGQTGVDQAALKAASDLGISVGGWCPKGGLDENKKNILNKYPLCETKTSNLNERTELNITDSDCTLILVPSYPIPYTIRDGTLHTITMVKAKNKPYLIVHLSKPEKYFAIIKQFLEKNGAKTLNISGPRESSSPEIFKLSYKFLYKLFSELM